MKSNQIELVERKLSDNSLTYSIRIFSSYNPQEFAELDVANRNEAYELKSWLDALVVDVVIV